MKSKAWKTVTKEEAKQHPLYGIGGWLLVFALGLVLGTLYTLGTVAQISDALGTSVGGLTSTDHPLASLGLVIAVVQLAGTAIILALLVSKQSRFRVVSSVIMLLSWPVIALLSLLNPFPGLGAIIVQGGFAWLLTCAAWVTYLQRSVRVRVTFENCVRKEESTVRGGAAISQNSLSTSTPSDEFWAEALKELDGSDRRQGLWARSFAEANGNESIAKAFYLKARAQELFTEQQAVKPTQCLSASTEDQLQIAKHYFDNRHSSAGNQQMALAMLTSLAKSGCEESKELLKQLA